MVVIRVTSSDIIVLTPSITTTGIPVALRVIHYKSFVRGPFHLGTFSFPVAIGCVMWIMFISIVFILPQVNVCGFLLDCIPLRLIIQTWIPSLL
jgi:hypothetical protein